jgi:rubrerythrin
MKLPNNITEFYKMAADTGLGTSIANDPFPNTKEFTSQISSLITMAIGDECHAISVYDAMINALEEDDTNVSVLEELKFDEQVHERVLYRILGNDLPILENAPPEPGEIKTNPRYDQLEDQGKFFTKFSDLINMAIGDERHAISLYSTILESMLPDDKNYTVIVQVMSDEQDHQKKLLRMLGEKTPEPVEAT